MMITTKLLFMGIAISFFSISISMSKRPNQISDKIFVAFLLSIALPMLIALTQPYEINKFLITQRLRDFMPLTLGPFIALYAESLTQSNYALTKKSLYHFFPFLLFFVTGIFFSHFSFFDTTESVLYDAFQVAYSVTFLLSIAGYSIWLPRLLKKHRNRVLDYYAHDKNHISLIWISWVVYSGFVFFAVAHIPILLDALHFIPSNSPFVEDSYIARNIGFVIFLCILSFFGIKQTQVFTETPSNKGETAVENTVEEPDIREEPNDLVKTKSRAPIIHDEQLQKYLEILEDYVKAKKPYLDSELTLGSLAEMLNIPKHHLTETLNRKLEKNFYSYINEYRLEDLKNLLLDHQNASQSILTLAYQAGFNSKTTFNNFFKKSTRMTPSQFRKKGLSDERPQTQ
ncbi:helix-turn-helix domain-containing protein [Photobacterium sp. DNB23_23_1]